MSEIPHGGARRANGVDQPRACRQFHRVGSSFLHHIAPYRGSAAAARSIAVARQATARYN
jgi:hypothetical protein